MDFRDLRDFKDIKDFRDPKDLENQDLGAAFVTHRP